MSEIISDTEGALAVQVDYDLEDSSRNEAEPKETESFEIKTEHFEIGSELKADGQEEGVFVGYGSIFGNKDLGNDVVERGAFLKSLNDTGSRGVKLLWQHKTDQPIGIFEEIREDKKGLKVQGK